MQTIKVQFKSRHTGELRGMHYTYYAEDDNLQVGDEITIETKMGKSEAQVTQINVPDSEVITFKDYIKTIPKRNQLELEIEEDKEWS